LVGGSADHGGAGSVWVFSRSGSTWSEQGKKLTGNGESGDGNFGSSVALSTGDGTSVITTALIGGDADDSGAGAAWLFSSVPIVTCTVPGCTPAIPLGTPTVVNVTANTPSAYSFTLSTAGQPTVASDSTTKLSVPAGKVTFKVTNPDSSILSDNFKVCSAPLSTAVAKGPVISLPNTCTGTKTPAIAPGGPVATLDVDFTKAGSYEYLSSLSGAALAEMKGVLVVT
jgi:hypothetical protein